MRLKGKTAVIVGAGQTPGGTIGNGRAMAILFAKEGAQVFCVDRDLGSAQETAGMITDETGRASAHQADITSPDDITAMVEQAQSTLGAIDILINNVGIGAGDRKIAALAEDTFDQIIDVNLKGMWLTIKQVIPVMKAQGSGAIVNISSMASVLYSGTTAYELSKAAVNKLTQSTAAGYAQYGIRCNAVLPGLMNTPMAVDNIADLAGIPIEDYRAKRDAMVPLGRTQGTAWDTAHAAMFLASDDAKFITGALLPVDGGIGVTS